MLVDARSLPLARPAGERWWPPAVEGYGCLRSNELWAPFFVAWDRAAAPDRHRRQRVQSWAHARTAVTRPWGADGLPPVLVVCPSELAFASWEQHWLEADAHNMRPPALFLVSRSDLRTYGAGGPVWCSPGGASAEPLADLLGWGGKPSITAPSISEAALDAVMPPRGGRPLREWAISRALDDAPRPAWEQAAALALAAGPQEQVLINWTARHRCLSAGDLAAVTGEPRALVEKRLEGAARRRVITGQIHPGATSERSQPMTNEPEVRYVLTRKGMEYLAANAGVSSAVFRRHAGIAFFDPGAGERPLDAVPHVEHTIGVNRVVACLAADARAQGGRLAQWLNEAESAHRFVTPSGRRSWIRPDASGRLDLWGGRHWFLLEYERGTLDGGDLRVKLAGYRRYYDSCVWEQGFPSEPVLLFVCADDRAERRVLHALAESTGTLPAFVTAEWRFTLASSRAAGMLDRIWRCPGQDRLVRAFVPPDGHATGGGVGEPSDPRSGQ